MREVTGDEARPEHERAMLVSVLLPHARVDFKEPLSELHALADSASVEVVDAMVQKRTELDTRFGLGKGRAEELAERVEASEVDVVIFDNDLSPRQIRNLEELVACKVIDRSELILDIFASRARTRAARLQVELAQLQYTAPRLRGLWTHLERIAGAGGATKAGAIGGVGTRGPGERQIEIDRRIVKDRISQLRREIDEIDRRTQREVHARRDMLTVSLVGYTNSGKTTLLHALTGADRRGDDRLFATLDTKTVRWDLGDGKTVLLSDTVGFIRDLPHHLVASFRATLEQAIHADLLLNVVDVSSPHAPVQVEIVEEVLTSLGCADVPRILLLNKIDLAEDLSVATVLESRFTEVLRTSAVDRTGLAELTERVRVRAFGETVDVQLLVPHADGHALAEIDRVADVRERLYGEVGVTLDVRIPRIELDKLLAHFHSVSVAAPHN